MELVYIVLGSTIASNVTNSNITCTPTTLSCTWNSPEISNFPQRLAATNRIAMCTADVKTWMASHNLLLNEQKTEVVVIAAPNRSRVHRPVVVAIDVCGVSVTPKPAIRDIGVEIDDTMSMAVHVRRVCQVAYCHIRSIAKIRKCLTTAACKTI